MKCFLMYQHDTQVDDSWVYGIYLDEKNCITDMTKLNEGYEKYKMQFNICKDCYDRDTDIFKNEESCSLAKVYKDRHGKYCDNDHTETYGIAFYSYTEVELRG